MNSILDNRPALKAVIDDVAEVTGYLWQKGWAERNGGNITVNITEYVDSEIASLPALAPARQIGKVLPALKGKQRHGQAHARPGPMAHEERSNHPHLRRLCIL